MFIPKGTPVKQPPTHKAQEHCRRGDGKNVKSQRTVKTAVK